MRIGESNRGPKSTGVVGTTLGLGERELLWADLLSLRPRSSEGDTRRAESPNGDEGVEGECTLRIELLSEEKDGDSARECREMLLCDVVLSVKARERERLARDEERRDAAS